MGEQLFQCRETWPYDEKSKDCYFWIWHDDTIYNDTSTQDFHQDQETRWKYYIQYKCFKHYVVIIAECVQICLGLFPSSCNAKSKNQLIP